VLTLYTTPVIYLFMDNLRLKIQGDKNARLFTKRPDAARRQEAHVHALG
jgi:type VI protein secretion system component VasA